MGMWTVVWFYVHCSEWSTSINCVIFPQHNHHQSQLQYTQYTCKALSSPRTSPSINYLCSFPQSNLSFFSSLSIMLPLYSILLVSKPPSSPSLLLPVFHLFSLTVYLIQSKLLHSSQTSITASDNLVVWAFYNPHSPPLYVGVALYHCMTDYCFTLSSRTLLW